MKCYFFYMWFQHISPEGISRGWFRPGLPGFVGKGGQGTGRLLYRSHPRPGHSSDWYIVLVFSLGWEKQLLEQAILLLHLLGQEWESRRWRWSSGDGPLKGGGAGLAGVTVLLGLIRLIRLFSGMVSRVCVDVGTIGNHVISES